MIAFRSSWRADAFRSVLGFTFRHWLRQPWLAGGIAASMLLATMADVLVPLFAGQLVEAVASPELDRAEALNIAVWALGIIILLGLGMVGFRHLAYRGIERMSLKIMRDVAADAFAQVQRLSHDWHANTFAGSTVRKITRGVWALDLLDDTLLLALLPSTVVLVGSTILLGAHWPVMGVVVGLGTVAYIGMTVAMSLLYVAPAARLANSWDTRLGGSLADAVTCNAVVKAFGAEEREDARLAVILEKWRNRTRRTWRRGTNNAFAQLAALLALRAAVIATVLWLWWQGRATPGDVAYVLTTFFVIQGYMRDVGMHIRNLQRAVNDMEELVDMEAEAPGVADRPGAGPLVVTGGEVVFDRVTFHYKGHETPLYRDFSLRIGAGEKVGLVGHSGSGKTTFVRLLQRLYDVNEGRILIDGTDISQVGQASLRSQIAIVPQEPILFHRSLAENIAYARPGATMKEIVAAAELAHAHGFVARLPRGYRTLVGERGIKLSGGERQRVALARAFLADAPILVLDEATSSLDSESEALIQDAMQRLMAGRTAIVIAHRLSTVRMLDRILVFDRGRVVEEGDHDRLVRSEGGIYRRLFERQALGLATDRQVA